jgi:serine/threonine-protein kinase RsbW/stage II sporulation protein AB (anti-sigma F factor)
MTRKLPRRADRSTHQSRRSHAVDTTLAAVVLDAQRRLKQQSEAVVVLPPPDDLPDRPKVFADQRYADQLIELVHLVPGQKGVVPAASWVLPAEPLSVGALRDRIVAFGTEHRVPPLLLSDIKLAASEALTNAVVHAFRDRVTPGLMTASIKIDRPAGRVTLLVADDGGGMRPRPDSPGLGVGLPLIATVSSLLAIRPGTGGAGTQVCVTFAYS